MKIEFIKATIYFAVSLAIGTGMYIYDNTKLIPSVIMVLSVFSLFLFMAAWKILNKKND